jgi:hypothetical protein
MSLGFWLLAFGFWLLAFGFWLLAFGFWLLAKMSGSFQTKAKSQKLRASIANC